jgi:hypothetical protein
MRLILIAAGLLAMFNAPALAQSAAAPREIPASGTEPISLERAKALYTGPLSRVVLDFLTVMDEVVNKPKQPPLTKADWEPLGRFIDQPRFRRVGNFGVRNDWNSYSELLAGWARGTYWKGYIWRMREVPGGQGQPGLVYLETEERSNPRHPVREDGDYTVFPSIAVYEIDGAGKITSLYVYDQRPQ